MLTPVVFNRAIIGLQQAEKLPWQQESLPLGLMGRLWQKRPDATKVSPGSMICCSNTQQR